MINDTNIKNKRPEKRLQSFKNRGFIRLFILIVVVVAALIYFGLDPKGVWENLIQPVLEWAWDIFMAIIGFFFDIAIWFIEKLRNVLGI